ncbi:hypothetical protein [Haloferax prahovense]|uniref:hypothetical protein n=1 Tax=Haloferax prahovense TaxID=381852 RepID=UPI0012DC68A3|nr:hypothetical protein [Haloferax prahovense]
MSDLTRFLPSTEQLVSGIITALVASAISTIVISGALTTPYSPFTEADVQILSSYTTEERTHEIVLENEGELAAHNISIEITGGIERRIDAIEELDPDQRSGAIKFTLAESMNQTHSGVRSTEYIVKNASGIATICQEIPRGESQLLDPQNSYVTATEQRISGYTIYPTSYFISINYEGAEVWPFGRWHKKDYFSFKYPKSPIEAEQMTTNRIGVSVTKKAEECHIDGIRLLRFNVSNGEVVTNN